MRWRLLQKGKKTTPGKCLMERNTLDIEVKLFNQKLDRKNKEPKAREKAIEIENKLFRLYCKTLIVKQKGGCEIEFRRKTIKG